MSTSVFDMFAKLSLDSSAFESGLKSAKSGATLLGNGISKAMKIGVTAITAATTAMVTFAASSVKTGMEFDTAISEVAATMGKTVDEMNEEIGTVELSWGTFTGNIREYAIEMGEHTVYSATEAAEALNYMALAGYDVQTSMETLPSVLNLASAGSMELATASDMVTDTQTAFGISLERTEQMVDEMAKAASTGNTSVEQLGDAFLTVGGLASELNGGLVTLSDGTQESVDGVQELEIALTAMANAGIKGSEAGTHMRNMLLKLSDPTDAGTKALEDMGVAIYDVEGNMNSLTDIFSDLNTELGEMTQQEKISTISDLFNTRDLASAEALLGAVEGTVVKLGDEVYSVGTAYEKWGDAIYDSSQGFEIVQSSWDSIGESILDAKGSAEEMAAIKLDNLAGDITLFESAVSSAKIAVSDSLTPTLREFVQLATDGVSDIASAFREGGLEEAMGVFGTWLSTAIETITDKLPEMIGAGSSLLENLIKGITDNIDKIADAATTIILKLVSSLETTLPKIGEVATTILMTLVNMISDNAGDILTAGADVLTNFINGLTENADDITSAVGTILDTLVNFINNDAGEIVTAAVNLLAALATGLANNVAVMLPQVITIVPSIVSILLDNISTIIDAGLTLISALATGAIEAIPVIIEAIPDIITSIIDVLVDGVGDIATAGVTILTALIQNLPAIVTAITNAIPQIVTAIVDFFSGDGFTQLSEAYITLMTAIISAMPQILTQVASATMQIPTQITATLTNNKGAILDAAINMLYALCEALVQIETTVVTNLKKYVSDWATIMTNQVEAWKTIGGNLVRGLYNGISDKISWLTGLVTSMGSQVLNKLKSVLGISSPSKKTKEMGQYLAEGLGIGWEDEIDNVKKDIGKDLDMKGSIDLSSTYEDSLMKSSSADKSDSTLDALLKNLSITLYNTTEVDGTALKKEAYKYTIERIGNETRAVRIATGGVY